MRLLVTGASGLVGRHVLAEAIGHGCELHAVTSNPAKIETVETPGIHWHVENLLAPGKAAALVNEIQPTHMIHCAWDTRHTLYWNSPDNLTWLATTTEITKAFARGGGRRFVLVGTCAEYDWRHDRMIEGVTPEIPKTLYGSCKLAAHQAVQGAARALGFSAVTGRIFFCYGPHENSGRLIPYICQSLAAGKIPALSSGRQLRDLVHVRDAARAFVMLLQNETMTGAVNIGSGEPVTLGAVAGFLADAAGVADQSRIGALAGRDDDPMILLPSVDRLFSIGWRPNITLRVGLEETYQWWARASRQYESKKQ